MKKLLLASAVSALFAAPTAVLAQAAPASAAPAAPAAPTLDKVLEASGISLSGYVDVAYEAANRNIDPSVLIPGGGGVAGRNNRVFDWQRNSFVLHQVGLTAAKQPKEGFGGLLNITAGRDAPVVHSFDTVGGQNLIAGVQGTTDTLFDVTQAFGQWASGPLTIMAGKFVTLHGTEVIASTGNTNFSRSMLFGAVPFTHTGVRGTYAVNDMLSLTAGVNNGWDQVRDMNKSKTIELMATITPIKPLTIVLSDMSGKENILPGDPSAGSLAQGFPSWAATVLPGNRNSFNAVATWTATDALSIGLEGLTVSQEFASPTGATGRYNGFAGYLTYMFTPQWRGVLRAETFNDKDGIHFGVPSAKYNEWTLTGSYLPNSSFELRAEVRRDRSSSPSSNTVAGVPYGGYANGAFVTDAGAQSRDLTTFAIQALYKF